MRTRVLHRLIGVLGTAWLLVMPGPATAGSAEEAETLEAVPELPRDAILRYARTDLEEWHYLRERVSDDGVVVDRHDPTLPGEEHWQLVSIDGRTPTEREIRKYEKDRADHTQSEERADRDNVLRVLVPESVRLLERDGETQRFGYDMRSPDGKRERMFESLEGDFLVDMTAEEPWVRTVRVWNRETLRPVLGVRIDQADIVFEFTLKDGWVLPAQVEARWSGEILRLKDIGKEVQVTLRDFRRVDTPAGTEWVASP